MINTVACCQVALKWNQANIRIYVAPKAAAHITYQASYNLDTIFDVGGVVVEISNDNGLTWTDLAPDEGYPVNFSLAPDNFCMYPTSQNAFNGSTGNTFEQVSYDLRAYQGQSVQIRLSLSTNIALRQKFLS